MRSTTMPALALAGALAVAPAAADAEPAALDPPSPDRTALRAPLAGHVTVAAQMRAERHADLRARLAPRAVRLASRIGRPAAEERLRVRGLAPDELRERISALRRERAEPAAPPALEAIAACESGGNPGADTGNGFYGKYQFTLSTWASVGGSGNPAAASEAEQDMRAAMLYAREGATPWPVCGR